MIWLVERSEILYSWQRSSCMYVCVKVVRLPVPASPLSPLSPRPPQRCMGGVVVVVEEREEGMPCEGMIMVVGERGYEGVKPLPAHVGVGASPR